MPMAADKFSLLAGIASDWWWEMDAELRFTTMSDRFEEVFGFPGSTLVGKRRTDVARTDYDTPAWRGHLDDLANRRPFRNFETTCVDADGVSRPVMISGAPRFGADGAFAGYIGVGHDLTELRVRERELAATARSLQSVLENVDQGVVHFDADMRVAAYNRRLADWLEIGGDGRGLSYESIVRGLAARGEYAPEDPEEAIARRLALVEARRRFVGERRRHDGRVISVGWTPLPEGGGVMTYSDVTEARTREARLEEGEAKFRYLFLHSPMPMWVYAVDTRRILEVNDAAVAAYGYPREEFLGLTLYDLRPAEDAERLDRYIDDKKMNGLYAGEWRHRYRDGRIAEVDVYLHDIEFDGQAARLSLMMDVTERNRMERESRRIFETSEDLILVTDGYGRFVRVSPSCRRLLGCAPEEMVGRLASEFVVPEDLETTREEMRRARRGAATGHFRCRYRHRDGHAVPLAWISVWSEPDRRHFFIGRDMTEYDRTAESLRQAVKMEAVGQLTGGVAHDFNNILMVIMANLEGLEDEQPLEPPAQARVRRMAAAVRRAGDLTLQLLAFSRKQPLRPQRTDINELVLGAVKLLRRALPETVTIETDLAPALWPADVDRARLESALVNLAINARDAMPAGGRLVVSTANDAAAGEGGGGDAGDCVSIVVADTGCGMPPEVLEKVFEPFFTTKGVGQGSGLGLSMVYGFVEQSGGHVRIDSEVGHGTAVRLLLPRASRPAEAAAAAAAPSLPRGRERLLVVEDDPDVREGVVQQLVDLGYDVASAADGTAALAALAAASQPFDLVLTDIVMPGPVGGKRLADRVAETCPSTRIVFMSGYTEGELIHDGRVDEGVLLLGKPFRKAELAAMVRQALDGG